MALVFRNSPEAPAQCALELSRADKEHPELKLRMGIHSGPINVVTDVNERVNVTGAGINLAQRVMDCGGAGHILFSKRAADDLAEYRHWQPLLHEIGECEVKHGVRLPIWKRWLHDTTITIGCNNVFGQDPPDADTSTNYADFLYDSTGRFLYVSLTKKF